MLTKLLEWYYRWKNWLVGLFFPLRLEREMEIEMQSHLQFAMESHEQTGMSAGAARKAALKGFGNVESLKEDCRDSWGARVVTDLIRDGRYSARSLWKSRGFSVAVVSTLALCIGANIAIFSALYHFVLKGLPFDDPERIARVFYVSRDTTHKSLAMGSILDGASYYQYDDFRKETDLFEAISIHYYVSGISESTQLKGVHATASFFDVMRVKPVLGRFYSEDETYPTESNVVVLSQSLWESRYDSDPNVIGKEMAFLNKPSRTIIGVAPRSLELFDRGIRFFSPYRHRIVEGKRVPDSALWIRLKPGVSHDQVAQRLLAIEKNWNEENATAVEQHIFERDQRRFLFDLPHPFENQLKLLQVGALFVLLIGCVNVANLLLSRANRRQNELSIRYSCGAGRVAIGRVMLSESLLLALLGAMVGSVLAVFGLHAVNHYLTALDPTAAAALIDGTIILWILGAALVIALVMGLLPFALLWRSGCIKKLDTSGRMSSSSLSSRALSNGLVVLQVSITCALLIGAGLLTRSLYKVMQTDPGFDPTQVIQARVKLREVYKDNTHWVGARTRILESMREIAGVEAVGFRYGMDRAFYRTKGRGSQYAVKGIPVPDGENGFSVQMKWVDGEFFDAMGVAFLSGRPFVRKEVRGREYIVDQAFVERYLDGKEAIGMELDRRFSIPKPNAEWGRIVGVVSQINYEGRDAPDGLPLVYENANDGRPLWGFLITLRTRRSLESIAPEMQTKLREVHPNLHLYDANTLDVPYEGLNLERRGMALLIGLFAGLALVLSAIGIYGVLAYSVEQRRREIGIRAAIGATRSEVLGMVMNQGLRRTLIGLGLGLLGSLYLNRFLESQLFDISRLDTVTYLATLSVLVGVAVLASYLPGRRAVKIDPSEALRAE